MSVAAIRAAFETALNGIAPAIATAWENVPFEPTPGVPYQAAYLLCAAPANLEIGPGYIEQGIFQVNLFYPKDAGSKDVTARAELIRATFPFGASLAMTGGGTVNIIATPEIGPARADGDRQMVPVKVKFQARIGG